MENFKFVLFSIFVLALLGFASYWAFSTIETGSSHVDNQKLKELESNKVELEKQVADLTRENSLLKESEVKETPVVPIKEPEVVTTPTPTPTPTKTTTTTTKTTTLKYQSLINELQKLVDGNIYLKLKSQGDAVGTVQKFLNVYNNTSNKIDNDYGASTISKVKDFQKAQKITADGESGSGTFNKMISWLKTKK